MKLSLKSIFQSLCCSLALTSIAACSANDKKPRDAQLITIDIGMSPETLDPQLVTDSSSSRVINDLFEGLTSFDQSNEIIPGLAKSWSISSDNTRYIFHLRSNLNFSDGTPITAQDVVFSWQRLVDPQTHSTYSFLLNNVKNAKEIIAGRLNPEQLGIKALDNETLQVTLNYASDEFLATCSHFALDVISKNNVRKYGNSWTLAANIVTSGAYKLKNMQKDGTIELTKNDSYYSAQHTLIPNVNLVAFADSESALSNYLANKIDISWNIPITKINELKTRGDIYNVLREEVYYYDFNMQDPLLKNNLNLRKALSLAINRGELVDLLDLGQLPLYSFVTPTIEGGKLASLNYDWYSKTIDKNGIRGGTGLGVIQIVQQAKTLFAAAGYSEAHPLKLELSINNIDSSIIIAEKVIQMWEDAFGKDAIQISLKTMDWKSFNEQRKSGSFQLVRDAWISDNNSANSYVSNFLCNNPTNESRYCNPEYDKLIAEAMHAKTNSERVRLMRKAIMLAMADYPVIPLFQDSYTRLIKPYVHGYDPTDNHLDRVMSQWYHF